MVADGVKSAAKKPRLNGSLTPAAVVLDIEGTVAPISFVTETLFPYARAHLREHLEANFGSSETQADIALLQKEVFCSACQMS